MEKMIIPALAAFLCSAAVPAFAADVVTSASIADALNSPEARKVLTDDVKLYFGSDRVRAAKVIGEWSSNRHARKTSHPDQLTVCHAAFAKATFELQKRAREEGGNAVINITGLDKEKTRYSDRNTYVCRGGRVMISVGLRGTVVKTK